MPRHAPQVTCVLGKYLGGKDNYAADRAVADEVMRLLPNAREGGLELRAQLACAARVMVAMGIRQFIDLGSGLPTVENTHQIVQAVEPSCRVVYVDDDPVVLIHGKALLAENDRTVVITADVRDPEALLAHSDLLRLVDLAKPVGLIMLGIVHHFSDDDHPAAIVNAYKDAAAPGSALLLSHFCADEENRPVRVQTENILLSSLGSGRFRTRSEITAYFDGWDLVEPGVIEPVLWRPETPVSLPLDVTRRGVLAGLATKPRGKE